MDPAPQHSPALQRALELREEGKSLRVIAGILEAEAVPTPGRVKKWSHKAVARLFEPPSPSTTPGPAPVPVEIPAPADAVLTRLAGQIAELEELNEEREALDRGAAEQFTAVLEGVTGLAERWEQMLSRAAQQHQQHEQLSEKQARVVKEWSELWRTRWERWLAQHWRQTLVPLVVGLGGGIILMLGVVGGKLGWEAVKSLLR